MNYGDIKSQVVALLNRRDNTPTLTTSFIQSSLQKIQRTLRVPAMEKSIVATIGNIFTDGLPVPGDLLQFQALTDVLSGFELTRTSLPVVLAMQKNSGPGCPKHFTRRGGKYLIGPLPQMGSQLRLDYYAAFKPLSADADTNVLTDIAPDLIIRGALVFAATHFSDKRKDGFKTDYNEIFDELQDQANRDELTGNAVVAPAYRFDDED